LQNGEVKTLEEAGKAFGVRRERVRQIKNQNLSRIIHI
jgi:DNA-directed RNA polymerase sigma subunit (sigma70/sigma32)